MKSDLKAALLCTCLMMLPAFAWAAFSPCADLVPVATIGEAPQRLITADDLVRLRDIGPVDVSDARAPMLSISPDGKHVAFQMRRADPVTNDYCLGMFVAPVKSASAIVPVNLGGSLIRGTDTSLGFTGRPDGIATITPKWSPDGVWIAFLRDDDGRTEVWRAQADGSSSSPLTHLGGTIDAFEWTPNGHGIVFRALDRRAVDAAIEAEGRRGYLYDDRYRPIISSKPLPRGEIPSSVRYVEVGTGDVRAASSLETALLAGNVAAGLSGAIVTATDARGNTAWVTLKSADKLFWPTVLNVMTADGRTVTCERPDCDGIIDLWWTSDAKEVVYLRRMGWRLSQTGLFRWRPGKGAPRQVLVTDDALIGCHYADDNLICGREASLQPRRIDSINTQTGVQSVIFDPNPEFASLRLGKVERLKWTNPFGIETFGDLVLPPDYRRGEKLPLVVVGYQSRGFLRGGTGDDYPIQLFAAHKFAVLSFQRPIDYALYHGAKTGDDMARMDRKDSIDWKSVGLALGTGIDILDSRGVIDNKRIGLTGFSNGASAAQYELVNSHRFKAIALSQCCEDTTFPNMLAGPAYAALYQHLGYPALTTDPTDYWNGLSVRHAASRINTPLLIQMADSEYMIALESLTALQERNKPVEMYVFPDEDHVKWQPAHRLATYSRALDWFDFWLNGIEDSDPAKSAQYARWRTMRSQSQQNLGDTPGG
jgi:dipeptidyl aminopeptidase/acylaminoacyl peptidase